MEAKLNKYQIYLADESPFKRPFRIMLWVLFILPIIFLLFQSFDIYLISHILIMLIVPFFIWCYLEAEKVHDLKLDLIKIISFSLTYFSYLLALYLFILKILKSKSVIDFLLIEVLYLAMLLIIITSVSVTLLLKRHNVHKLKKLMSKNHYVII